MIQPPPTTPHRTGAAANRAVESGAANTELIIDDAADIVVLDGAGPGDPTAGRLWWLAAGVFAALALVVTAIGLTFRELDGPDAPAPARGAVVSPPAPPTDRSAVTGWTTAPARTPIVAEPARPAPAPSPEPGDPAEPAVLPAVEPEPPEATVPPATAPPPPATPAPDVAPDAVPVDGAHDPFATDLTVDEPAPAAPPAAPVVPAPFSPGVHVVGIDLAPGRYTTPVARDCAWRRLSDPTGVAGTVLAEGRVTGQAIIDVLETDVALQTGGGCGTLVPLRSLPLVTTPSDGDWLVGYQMAFGQWRPSNPASCSWWKVTDFTGTPEAVVAQGTLAPGDTVELVWGDIGFQSRGCGSWVRR
jgi:hypothetical protein